MPRHRRRRPTLVRPMATLLVLALGILLLPTTVTASTPATERSVPSVPGYPPVASPKVTAPAPLPRMEESVPLDADLHIGTGGTTSTQTGSTSLRSRTGSISAAETSTATAAAAPNGKVALRALLVAVDEGDWGVATWKATLDRVGAAYDVL